MVLRISQTCLHLCECSFFFALQKTTASNNDVICRQRHEGNIRSALVAFFVICLCDMLSAQRGRKPALCPTAEAANLLASNTAQIAGCVGGRIKTLRLLHS